MAEEKLTKRAETKAYDAGRANARMTTWPDTIPEEFRMPGVRHCPFAEGDPQREPWLRGLRDGLVVQEEQDKARKSTLSEIDKELG